MNIKQALKKRDKGTVVLSNIYQMARISGLPARVIQDKWIVWKKENASKVPQWVVYYWYGYEDSMREMLYRNDLEFCYIVNDTRYSIRKESPLYYRLHGLKSSDCTDCPSGFYWINTGKLYA